MSYRRDGLFTNHLSYAAQVTRGDLQHIPEIASGMVDGAISFLDDGQIYQVALPVEIANHSMIKEVILHPSRGV